MSTSGPKRQMDQYQRYWCPVCGTQTVEVVETITSADHTKSVCVCRACTRVIYVFEEDDA
jgi:transcription elongation factor Elf1